MFHSLTVDSSVFLSTWDFNYYPKKYWFPFLFHLEMVPKNKQTNKRFKTFFEPDCFAFLEGLIFLWSGAQTLEPDCLGSNPSSLTYHLGDRGQAHLCVPRFHCLSRDNNSCHGNRAEMMVKWVLMCKHLLSLFKFAIINGFWLNLAKYIQ